MYSVMLKCFNQAIDICVTRAQSDVLSPAVASSGQLSRVTTTLWTRAAQTQQVCPTTAI